MDMTRFILRCYIRAFFQRDRVTIWKLNTRRLVVDASAVEGNFRLGCRSKAGLRVLCGLEVVVSRRIWLSRGILVHLLRELRQRILSLWNIFGSFRTTLSLDDFALAVGARSWTALALYWSQICNSRHLLCWIHIMVIPCHEVSGRLLYETPLNCCGTTCWTGVQARTVCHLMPMLCSFWISCDFTAAFLLLYGSLVLQFFSRKPGSCIGSRCLLY